MGSERIEAIMSDARRRGRLKRRGVLTAPGASASAAVARAWAATTLRVMERWRRIREVLCARDGEYVPTS